MTTMQHMYESAFVYMFKRKDLNKWNEIAQTGAILNVIEFTLIKKYGRCYN